MEVKILKKEENFIEFIIKDVNFAFVNALRRAIISEVPVMAIERAIFEKNSSALPDEVLAHRLGLIPLKTPINSYVFQSECDCNGKGCAKCTAEFTMDVKCPEENETITIYSKDLIPKDLNVVPLYDNIPIVILGKGQEIKLEAKAILGKGTEHAKWQAGLASYEENNNEFKFFIESFGNYNAKDLLNLAIDTLIEENEKFKKYVLSIKNGKNI
ncbi:MAG: DNA-directed RNA polymerase subunit D [Candidatus Altarchaeaceae archaeon]